MPNREGYIAELDFQEKVENKAVNAAMSLFFFYCLKNLQFGTKQ